MPTLGMLLVLIACYTSDRSQDLLAMTNVMCEQTSGKETGEYMSNECLGLDSWGMEVNVWECGLEVIL